MNDSKTALQAVRLKGRIGHDRKLEIIENLPDLPEGDVEVILLYNKTKSNKERKPLSPLMWPVLDGGRYLGDSLCREDLYGDDER
jgi:hypothetical protein